jgi:hypothetical protein
VAIFRKGCSARFGTYQSLFLAKYTQEKHVFSVQDLLRMLVDKIMQTEEGKQIMQKPLIKTNLVDDQRK